AGDGDDVFNLDSFLANSHLAIHAADGVDNFYVSPGVQSVTAALLGMSSSLFDGGKSFDHFWLYNSSNADPWTYTFSAPQLVTNDDAIGRSIDWQLAHN